MGILGDKIDEKVTNALLASERHMAEIAVGLAAFQNGHRITAARSLPVNVARAWGGSGRVVGWSVKATGGPVTVYLRDSRDVEGQVLAVIDLTDGQHETVSLAPGGVSFGEGLFLDKTGAGTLAGAVWLGAVD